MDKELLFKNIEKCLDALSATTNWIIGSLIFIIFSFLSREGGKVNLFGADIPEVYAGLALFIIITGLTYYLYKLSKHLFYYYEALTPVEQVGAKALMETHLWICSPFARTRPGGHTVTDSIGFTIFTLIWWLGLTLAFSLSFWGNVPPPVWYLNLLITGTYIFLGIVIGLFYLDKNGRLFPNKRRALYTWVALGLGITLFITSIWFKDEISKLLEGQ